MRLARRLHALQHDEAGSALLEFAITSLVILMVILGIMESSLALYADHFVSGAARDAVRYAMVRGSSWTGTACSTTGTQDCQASASDITRYVASTVPPGIDASAVSATATWSGLTAGGFACDSVQGSNSPGCVVMVTVSYPFKFLLPSSALTIHLKSSSQMIISQ